jgi:hypothetical protein
MPKKNIKSQKTNKNKSTTLSGAVVRVPFRQLYQLNQSGAGFLMATVDLDPTNFIRLDSISANFEYFRFTEVTVKANMSVTGVSLYDSTLMHVTSSGGHVYLAYSREGSTDLATISSPIQLSQLEIFRNGNYGPDCPSLKVGYANLNKTPFKWFRTNGGNSPPYDEEQQGALYWAVDPDSSYSGINPVLDVLIEGVCEFQGMTDSVLHLSKQSLKSSVEEKKSDTTTFVEVPPPSPMRLIKNRSGRTARV